VVLAASLLLAGCRSSSGERDLLAPAKMQALLWDMMRADQFISDFVINKDTSRKRETESWAIYPQILQWHRVTADQFRYSLAYYRDHPDLLKPIMDSLSLPPRSVLVGPEASPPKPVSITDEATAPQTPPVRLNKDSMRRLLRNRDTAVN
jgi:hypothetical protein